MSSNIKEKLIEIVGNENIEDNPKTLENYSKDLSLISPKKPVLVIYPKNNQQVQKIIKYANDNNIPIIPVSSPNKYRFHGDTIPRTEGSIILDLSRMNQILRIDKKNRVIMVEPGVTYGQVIKTAKENGLKLLKPLYPRSTKSVLASALEREPPTMPKYQWDSADPLLCTEVIFGTGDYFRTGIAAGPGTIEEQLETGQAQKNPMGPTQFSPYRIIQGAQGSIGVVTWATIKCEYLHDVEKILYSQSDNLQDFFDFIRFAIMNRMPDDLFILNKLNLAALLNKKLENLKDLKEWILLMNITGRGTFKDDKIEYLQADINDYVKDQPIKLTETLPSINNDEVSKILHDVCDTPWQLNYKGGFQDIFYITTLERTPKHYEIVKGLTNYDIGVYIQPIIQGSAVHCEFNLFYDPEKDDLNKVKEDFMKISIKLMENGAFFNRPYGLWADEVYSRTSEVTVDALKKVKSIFDPNNILNRGVLCFKEE